MQNKSPSLRFPTIVPIYSFVLICFVLEFVIFLCFLAKVCETQFELCRVCVMEQLISRCVYLHTSLSEKHTESIKRFSRAFFKIYFIMFVYSNNPVYI